MVAEMTFSFVFFCLVTFALTSGILYSELVSEAREWWINKFKNSKLKYLGICSLCLGFHVANFIQYMFLPYWGLIHYINFSLAAAGVTWMLSSWTNQSLWVKAIAEQRIKESNLRRAI